jgi:flagellar basal-body rod modification protein FlgD
MFRPRPLTIDALTTLLLNGGPAVLAELKGTSVASQPGPAGSQSGLPAASKAASSPDAAPNARANTPTSTTPGETSAPPVGGETLSSHGPPIDPHSTGPDKGSTAPGRSADASAETTTAKPGVPDQPSATSIPATSIAMLTPTPVNPQPAPIRSSDPSVTAAQRVTGPGGPAGVVSSRQADGGDRGRADLSAQNLRNSAEMEAPETRAAVVAQVARGLMGALKQNEASGRGGEVVLRLQPRALGDLKIKVTMQGEGLGAEFHASTKQARDLLGDSLLALRADLESKGLTVHRLDVQLHNAGDKPAPENGSKDPQGMVGHDAGGAPLNQQHAGRGWSGPPNERHAPAWPGVQEDEVQGATATCAPVVRNGSSTQSPDGEGVRMDAVSAISGGNGAAGQTVQPNAFSALNSEQFVKIMFTELSSQDPLKPNDSSAMLQQMSSLRSIQSDIDLSAKLQTIVSQNQMAGASGLIGRFVSGLADDDTRVTGRVASVSRTDAGPVLNLDGGQRVPFSSVDEMTDHIPAAPGGGGGVGGPG